MRPSWTKISKTTPCKVEIVSCFGIKIPFLGKRPERDVPPSAPTNLPPLQEYPVELPWRGCRGSERPDGASLRASEVANGRGAATKLTEISGRSNSSTRAPEGFAVPVQDFLSQRAVSVIVGGSYVLPNWYDPQGKLRTYACRTARVSPFRVIVEAPVAGKVGDRVTPYLRDLGKCKGAISATMKRSSRL